jgi:tetratricopeptide (TPR) repeat protein
VLVSAQLIDARDGRHIWAERYDRTMADSIGLQGELATEIAGALRMKLAPGVKASLEVKPTDNPDAYVFYLRGRDYQMRPEVSRDNFMAAENFYKQAVALDPRFALARARLAEMQNYIYGAFDHHAARLAEARSNAEEALRVDPNCGQAHMALAQSMQHADENPDAIKREVAMAVRLLPNDGYIALAAAILQDRMGWLDESAASFERAIVLNPREGKVFYNYAVLLHEQQDVPRSRWASDRALELSPESIFFRLFRARSEIEWTGDVTPAKTILAGLPAGKDPDGRVTAARCTVALYERNFPEALRLLAACSQERIPFLDMGYGSMVPKSFVQGMVQFYAGNQEEAYATLDRSRWMLEVEARENAGVMDAHFLLALAYAGMGWKDAAKAEVARSKEKLDDWGTAVLFGNLGEVDPALPALERVAAERWSNRNGWHLHPQFDSLRGDPRFQKLVAGNRRL